MVWQPGCVSDRGSQGPRNRPEEWASSCLLIDGGNAPGACRGARITACRKPLPLKVPETGLEPALPLKATRPSTWRVCQFRHSGKKVTVTIGGGPPGNQVPFFDSFRRRQVHLDPPRNNLLGTGVLRSACRQSKI